MTMRRAVALLLLLAACTDASPDPGGRVRGPTVDPDGEPVLPLAVVTTLSDRALGRTFSEGMRLAASHVNGGGGVAGVRLRLTFSSGPASLPDALEASVATLVVGPASVVAAARRDIERDGDPVFVLGGDLYSSRGLFRHAFQVSPPIAWQAEPLARYLVHDRGAEEIVLITEIGTDERVADEAFAAALAEEGSALESSLSFTRENIDLYDVSPAFGADAVALSGSRDVGTLAAPLSESETDPVVALFAEGLAGDAPAGAVVPYPYTWAGWADPIPRVRAFRERMERVFGHPPRGLEQEGYDAVRLLADALERTDGSGGPRLIQALERTTDATYSSLPITLGPDDHILAGRGQIGIFVRLAPGEIDATTSPTGIPWAPLMRTFTYNGRRTSIVDDDKRVFFPAWRRRAPAPAYVRARFGITTDASDPTH